MPTMYMHDLRNWTKNVLTTAVFIKYINYLPLFSVYSYKNYIYIVRIIN